jgi:hypothetical protein
VFRSRQRLPAAGKTPRQSWLFGCEFKFSQSRFVKFYIPTGKPDQAFSTDSLSLQQRQKNLHQLLSAALERLEPFIRQNVFDTNISNK